MAFWSFAIPSFIGGVVAAWVRKARKEKKKEGLPPRPGFRLWPELAQGKFPIACFELCQVLLMDDSNYPCWLVLVPQQNDVKEVIDLPQKDQQLLWEEVSRASRALRVAFPDPALKLNIAALGNMVSQLHVHVTLRSVQDPAWPGPCYGAVPASPYAADAREAVLQRLRAAL